MDQDETQRTVKQSDQDGQDKTRTMADQSAQPLPVAKAYVSDTKFQAGDSVGGAYIIIDLIGVGGMGFVYKVRHNILEKIYAMKTIDKEQITEIAWRRLQVEAQAIARINHPNIVGIHNLGLHEGSIPYYVMDFLEGKNLSQVLKRAKRLDLYASLPIFIEICHGLGFAHKKGIVHRDVKPGNIVILDKADASGAKVKLVDFGIAKLAGTVDPNNQKLTSKGEIFGSPLYMSPEQCEGRKIDARSDIYSLGCTFFETLTGQVPFRGENKVATMLMHSQDRPPTLAEACGLEFPDSIEHLVATMLAKQPMNRYPNLERVGSDLEKILAGEEINTAPFLDLERYGDADGNNIIDHEEEIEIVKPTQVKLNTVAIAGLILLLGAIVTVTFAVQSYNTRQAKVAAPVYPGSAAAIEKKLASDTTDQPTLTPLAVSKPNPQIETASESIAANQEQDYFSQTYNGGDSIRFTFPYDKSIGTIVKLKNMGYKNAGFPAKGRVPFKIREPMALRANEYLCAHPKLLDGFRADDLEGFSTPEVMDKFIDFKALMPYLAKFTNLKLLRIKSSEADNSIIPYLNKLPNLLVLNVTTTNVTGSGLAKFNRIRELQELEANFLKETPKLLMAIKGSKNLEKLFLENPDPMFTQEHAKILITCKRLRHLDLKASGITNETLIFLFDNLPQLAKMDASGSVITDETVRKIKAAHPERKITIEIHGADVNPKAFGDESPEDWLGRDETL